MRISVADARPYFEHPSQQVEGAAPDTIPENGCEYWADGPVCLIVHQTAANGIWMVHLAVKPKAWGFLTAPAERLLCEIWTEKKPLRIVAWINKDRRAAISFARRVGFQVDGHLPNTVMMGWRP
jgi:hypothetical protein